MIVGPANLNPGVLSRMPMELHAAGVWAQLHHGWQQCEPHSLQQWSVTFLVSEEIKTGFLRLTECKLFNELWWPEPHYFTFPCHYKENNLKWALMSGSWEEWDPVVEEQVSYFCSGVVPPNTQLLLWAQLLQTHAWNSAFPRGGRWGWARDSLPACLPITVTFAAWTVTVVMLAVGLRWLWAAEGRGCDPGLKFRRVSRAAATSGPPAVRPGGDCSSSGRRDVSAINESNEAAVDCTGTDVHTMVRLPEFPLQPSEALRADGRGERWTVGQSWLTPKGWQLFSHFLFPYFHPYVWFKDKGLFYCICCVVLEQRTCHIWTISHSVFTITSGYKILTSLFSLPTI